MAARERRYDATRGLLGEVDTMSNLDDKFSQFFKSRTRLKASAKRSWHPIVVAGHDPDSFSKYEITGTRMQGPPWDILTGQVYMVFLQIVSVMVTVYGNRMLWLDDHDSDVDFAEFLRRERLLLWLPDRLDAFLGLLLETKFSFLGQARIIASVQDIPFPDEDPFPAGDPHSYAAQREYLDREIAPLVHPPQLVLNVDQVSTLAFCIWTKRWGFAYKMTCKWGPALPWHFESVQLTRTVGRAAFPR